MCVKHLWSSCYQVQFNVARYKALLERGFTTSSFMYLTELFTNYLVYIFTCSFCLLSFVFLFSRLIFWYYNLYYVSATYILFPHIHPVSFQLYNIPEMLPLQYLDNYKNAVIYFLETYYFSLFSIVKRINKKLQNFASITGKVLMAD